MNLRFAAITTGCMLLGAAGAAYYRASAAPPEANSRPSLFLQAAIEAPTSAAWPPSGSVAFYDEMFALLTATATPRPVNRSANTQVAALDTTPETPTRAGVTPPGGNDTVEIVIRDRFGRPIRVERVDRRFAGPRAYPPPYGQHGPYGPYWPYRR